LVWLQNPAKPFDKPSQLQVWDACRTATDSALLEVWTASRSGMRHELAQAVMHGPINRRSGHDLTPSEHVEWRLGVGRQERHVGRPDKALFEVGLRLFQQSWFDEHVRGNASHDLRNVHHPLVGQR